MGILRKWLDRNKTQEQKMVESYRRNERTDRIHGYSGDYRSIPCELTCSVGHKHLGWIAPIVMGADYSCDVKGCSASAKVSRNLVVK